MDTYFDTIFCAQRLYKEWEKHPKLIIACDFDETVFDFHKIGSTHSDIISLLKECKAAGFYVVLFSASKPERYPFMIEFMKEQGIEVDAVNKNVIELPYGNNGKIYYNILLDDRAGLFQAATILSILLNRIK